jgi:glutamine synthetase
MIERAAAQGFTLKAAMENEFTLARRENGQYVPIDRSPCFSTIGMDSAAPVMTEIIEALTAQDVFPEQYYAELGPGQQELPVRYADVLRAADNQITVRPFADEAGNGAHIHFSLWRAATATNAFYDPRGAHGVSDIARAFIGGVLAHLPALVALTAPTVNSYRRLQPRFWCSAYTAWGPDNKEAAIRLPSPYRGAQMGPRWSTPTRCPTPSARAAASAACPRRSARPSTSWSVTRCCATRSARPWPRST